MGVDGRKLTVLTGLIHIASLQISICQKRIMPDAASVNAC